MSHERIEQLEIGKHVRLRSRDGRVKVDVHCGNDIVGVWVGCSKDSSENQLGIVAQTGRNPYFMLYTELSATVPVALSADGVQVPGPNGSPPVILSWQKVYSMLNTLLPQG